jgi:hypothetical protein
VALARTFQNNALSGGSHSEVVAGDRVPAEAPIDGEPGRFSPLLQAGSVGLRQVPGPARRTASTVVANYWVVRILLVGHADLLGRLGASSATAGKHRG